MESKEWLGCDLLEIVPGKVSGAVLFKGTRLPVDSVVENVDAFMEMEGLSLDEAIAETLKCFPSTPDGADGIRAVLAYRESFEHPLQV
jgi:uncharacterized protein (DUF433 family)